MTWEGGSSLSWMTSLHKSATWRSGYAADCKSVHTGSIPVVASTLPSSNLPGSVCCSFADSVRLAVRDRFPLCGPAVPGRCRRPAAIACVSAWRNMRQAAALALACAVSSAGLARWGLTESNDYPARICYRRNRSRSGASDGSRGNQGHTPRTDHHAKHAAGEDGANISYPSLIEVPEWVADPLGRYYLYFSSHRRSRYIRLVYANEITGPWTVYAPWDADRGSDAIAVRQRS